MSKNMNNLAEDLSPEETVETGINPSELLGSLGVKDSSEAMQQIEAMRETIAKLEAAGSAITAGQLSAAKTKARAKIRRIAKEAGITDIPELEDEKAGSSKQRQQRPANDDGNDLFGALSEHFVALGYDHDEFFFLPRSSQQIVCLNADQLSRMAQLSRLAPIKIWQGCFGDDTGAWYPTDAADYLINEMTIPAGPYNRRKIRGRGVWEDAGRTVIHLGDKLVVDGQETDIVDFGSKYVYERMEEIETDLSKVLKAEDGKMIRKIIGMSRWENQLSATLYAGWAFLAPVCGALKWRPHVYLIGASKAGKSSVMEIKEKMLGTSAAYYFLGKTTEAGIRQTIRLDSLPIVIDEFEAEDKDKDKPRLDGVTGLARQASSETQKRIAKGSGNGKAVEFFNRSMFFFGSINLNIYKIADETRTTVIKLRSRDTLSKEERKEDDARWAERERLFAKYLDDETLPGRVLARAVKMLPIIMESVQVFRAAAVQFPELCDPRAAQQIGSLLAGAWCLQNDKAVTEEQALEFIGKHDWSDYSSNEIPEEQRLLIKILQARAEDQIDGVRHQIGEMITHVGSYDDDRFENCLARCGIRVKNANVYISTDSDFLRRALEHTQWHARYNEILRRVKGSKGGGTKRFAGVSSNCICLNISTIFAAGDTGEKESDAGTE